MSGELERYQPEDPLERAIKESGKQGAVVFLVTALLHYGLSHESDRNFEDSLKFGAHQGAKQFLHSFADQL